MSHLLYEVAHYIVHLATSAAGLHRRLRLNGRLGTWNSSLADLPIPIPQASFCGIFLHIEIPPCFRRIAGRPN